MEIKEIIVASKNKGKIKEISDVLKDFNIKVFAMEEIGIYDEIIEDGVTFEENSYIKAMALYKRINKPVIADDSGLEIDFLGGKPGVFSARFAGENSTNKDKIDKILRILKEVPFDKRKARFVCVISLVVSSNIHYYFKGICNGFINESPIGDNGFGYDPIFFIEEKNKTIAQISSQEKNEISHRSIALKKMQKLLKIL